MATGTPHVKYLKIFAYNPWVLLCLCIIPLIQTNILYMASWRIDGGLCITFITFVEKFYISKEGII
ncbi:hypothetical protein P186_1428 [Pyrobaculum ferrireducens]|uniref:Uncharacterized protein n=1 Tax=Pyrobaculum ferrireducens TaxID=1104324 RepID=G7VEN7_9CREN|nr:hypothetical protein P186_1428 [Pyrobaculum ferrireducens]